MKDIMNLKYILLALSFTTAVTGCNEERFLDIKPQATLNNGNLSNPANVDLLINAAYAALMGAPGETGSIQNIPMTNWSYGEVRADNAYKGGGGITDVQDIHRLETFDVDATLGNVDSKWFNMYSCVQRCNSALKVLNTCSAEDVPNLASKKAEMRVLRAHFYFELSRLFKRIPYFDENVDINDYVKISNHEYSRNEILGMIADELMDAANSLPETQADKGRINRYIAWAYAAKVKLYQAYEQDENTHKVINVNKDLLKEVVDLCNRLDGRYDLLSDFQQLELVAYENGVESVFAVQYSMNDGSPNGGRINWSNLLNAPQGPYSGDGFFLPSQNLINAYQTDENGLPLFDTFNDHDYDVIVFDENGKAVNTQVDGTVDPRLDFVVGRPNITWKTYPETPCLNTWVRNQGDYGYHCTKRFYVSPESSDMYKGWPWGASGLNWQIIRYADVLLWKAEALIEIGDGAGLEEARECINRIRRRAKNSAYVKDFNDPSKDAANYLIGEYPADGWNQDYAREALRFETRLETAMEGERFFDLVRWGIAAETMNEYIDGEKDMRVYYSVAHFTEGRDEYLPISRAQYNFSQGNYVQNPGYGDF